MRTQELEMVSQELTFPLMAVKRGRKPKYTTKTTLIRKKGRSLKNIKLDNEIASFAWTLWNFELEIPEDIKEDKIEICIRAIDSNCNTQPEKIDALWNIRGLLNNSWHRIELLVTRQ